MAASNGWLLTRLWQTRVTLCVLLLSSLGVSDAVNSLTLPTFPVFLQRKPWPVELPDNKNNDVIHATPAGLTADNNAREFIKTPANHFSSATYFQKGPGSVPNGGAIQHPYDFGYPGPNGIDETGVNPNLPPVSPNSDMPLQGISPELLYQHFGPAPLDNPFGPVFHMYSAPHAGLLTGQPMFRPHVVPTDTSTGVKIGPRYSMFYNDPHRVQRMALKGAFTIPKNLLDNRFLPLYQRPDLSTFLKQEVANSK